MNHRLRLPSEALLLLSTLAAGCAATGYERVAYERLDARGAELRPLRADASGEVPEARAAIDGSLDGYVTFAMAHSPTLRGYFEEWRAAVSAIAEARRLPEPTVGYAYFLAGEGGGDGHRFSLMQMIPWPTRISAGADAASAAAEAAERRFQAAALALRNSIAQLYWQIWLHDHSHAILQEQQALTSALSDAIRSRVEIGQAGLAELAQVDLGITRLDDQLQSHIARSRLLRAELVAAIGAPEGLEVPINAPPPTAALPVPSDDDLLADAATNPQVQAPVALAEAARHRERAARAQGLPDFSVGVDYTIDDSTGGVHDPEMAPLMVSVGVTLPIWRGAYGAARARARAEAAGSRAQAAATRDRLGAELRGALIRVREAARRIVLHESTLLPQAESVYDAAVGAYQTGGASIATVIIAERDILELRLALAEARADHARAWAELESIVGHDVASQEVP